MLRKLLAAVLCVAALFSVAHAWSSATTSDSVGTVQAGGFISDSLMYPNNSDVANLNLHLIRSIYFSDTLGGGCPTWTGGKFQIAPAVDGTKANNSFWLSRRPAYIEAWVWTKPISVSRDSCWVAFGQLLVCDSAGTHRAGVAADSSSRFIQSGNFSLATYGLAGGRYEVLKDTTNKDLYSLGYTDGSYIQPRLSNASAYTGFTNTIADSVVFGMLIRFWGK